MVGRLLQNSTMCICIQQCVFAFNNAYLFNFNLEHSRSRMHQIYSTSTMNIHIQHKYLFNFNLEHSHSTQILIQLQPQQKYIFNFKFFDIIQKTTQIYLLHWMNSFNNTRVPGHTVCLFIQQIVVNYLCNDPPQSPLLNFSRQK